MFDELEFMVKVKQRVPEDEIQQLQHEFGDDIVGGWWHALPRGQSA